MFQSFVNQFASMSLVEEVHTLLFTAFLIGGAVCCLRRPGKRIATERTMPSRRKPKLVR
jgi:hypothetical protein